MTDPTTEPSASAVRDAAFDGRTQLVAYFHTWHPGRPAAQQCEGCTFSTSHVNELGYLRSRDVSWSWIRAGRDDDLGPLPGGWTACPCSLHTKPAAATK